MAKPRKFEKGKGYVPAWFIHHPSKKVDKHFDNGIPSGSIMQIQSDGEGTYKTSIAIQLAKAVQDLGYNVAYVDAENAVNWYETDEKDEDGNPIQRCKWFESMGLDSSDIYYIPNASQEQLYDDIKYYIKEKEVKFVIIDAIPSLEPEKVHENDAGDNIIGLRAKINTTELNKLTGLCREHHAIVCGINHKKDVITNQGSMGKRAVGGRGWGFYSQLIIVHKRTTSKSRLEGNNIIDLSIYIEKNKFGSSFIEIKEVVEQGKGIVPEYSILEDGLKDGTFVKAGSWFKLAVDPETGEVFNKEDQQAIGQGVPAAIEWIRENMEKFDDEN